MLPVVALETGSGRTNTGSRGCTVMFLLAAVPAALDGLRSSVDRRSFVPSRCRDHSGTSRTGVLVGSGARMVPFGQPIIASISETVFPTCHCNAVVIRWGRCKQDRYNTIHICRRVMPIQKQRNQQSFRTHLNIQATRNNLSYSKKIKNKEYHI